MPTRPRPTARPPIEDLSADEALPVREGALQRLLARHRAWQARSKERGPWLLVLAAGVFVVATVASLIALPPLEDGVGWWAAVFLVLVAVPATLVVNTAEYRVSANLLGLDAPWGPALEVSILASAANVLPIPGAAIVRSEALHRLGSSYRAAIGSTAVVGLAWVGASTAVAGVLLLVGGDDDLLGGGFLAAGIAALAATIVILRRRTVRTGRRGLVTQVLVIEAAAIGLNTLRVWLALHVIGIAVSPGQAATLAVSAVLASAVGFFPAGLGLREVFAAGMGPLVGLSTAESVVATAIDRIANLTVLALLSVVLVVRAKRRGDAA